MKTMSIAAIAMSMAAAAALAAPAVRVCVEAETATDLEEPMFLVTQDSVPAGTEFAKGASGDSYLEIPEGRGNPPKVDAGKATVAIEVPADGAYVLWARVWWEGECSNSFSVKVDDKAPFLFGEDGTFKSWHWVKYPVARTAKPIQLSKGAHTLVFMNREDGVRIDQVILAGDRRWVPVDIEPTTPAAK